MAVSMMTREANEQVVDFSAQVEEQVEWTEEDEARWKIEHAAWLAQHGLQPGAVLNRAAFIQEFSLYSES